MVSSRRDGFKPNGHRPTYSTTPSISRHSTQNSHGATATISAPQLNRWNSESGNNTSRSSSRRQASHKDQRQTSMDVDLLESNRESMKALAEFLRTKVWNSMVFYNRGVLIENRNHLQIILCRFRILTL